jgi:GR25 family glycosyltransferase involved in LPS biosynthesis
MKNTEIPIFVLNLNRATERKKEMIDQFHSLGISNYFFMPAYDGSYIRSNLNANISKGYGLGRSFQKAELAIIMTHISIYKYADMMGLDKIIILEDDVILCNDWDSRLETLNQMLETNWDFVYLSGHSDYVKFKVYEKPTLIPAPKMVGAFSYMVNHSAFRKLASYASSFTTTIDDMIMHMILEGHLKAQAFFPFMTFHNANNSYVWSETPGHIAHNNNIHSSYNYFRLKV